jgi:hypothetical protein
MADTEARLAVVETHIAATNGTLIKIEKFMERMTESMETLTRLDERDEVTRATLHDHETRLRTLEESAPITRQNNKWVDRAITAVCLAVTAALLKFVLITPPEPVKIVDQPQTTIRAH